MAASNYFNITVGTTAVAVTVNTAGEGVTAIYNNGTAPIYIGFDLNVTTANGFPIPAGASIAVSASGLQQLFAISGTAGQDVRVLLGSI